MFHGGDVWGFGIRGRRGGGPAEARRAPRDRSGAKRRGGVENSGRVEFYRGVNRFELALQRGGMIEKMNRYIDALQGLPGILDR